MSPVSKLVRRLGKDEHGASLIEYTVLLGILLIAVIVTIGAVGNWINSKWTALNANLT
jgi:pilus assembly protein Flp/PilA